MSERIEWTPDKDSALREHVAGGGSLTALAAEWGVNKSHLSRRAKRLGLILHTTSNGAGERTRERLTAAREQLAAALVADAMAIRKRIWDEYEVIVTGPNGPEHVTLDLPDAKAVADFTAAVERALKAHEQLERIGSARSSEVAKSAILKLQDDLQRMAADLEDEQ